MSGMQQPRKKDRQFNKLKLIKTGLVDFIQSLFDLIRIQDIESN